MVKERILQLMEASGVTEAQLARDWGVNRATVHRYFDPERELPSDFAEWAVPHLEAIAIRKKNALIAVTAKVA